MAIGDVFPNPTGKEYALRWGKLDVKGENGMIRMTDFLFNYYFYPTAWGLDGAYYEQTVRGSSNVSVTREIGGTSTTYSRASYKKKVVPTWRGGRYDSGTQCYAIDGDDVWNFEITGKLGEFRLWLDRVALATNLKRPLIWQTATGVGDGAVPFIAKAP